MAAKMRLLADDVACILFPRTGDLPSEELQATVRLVLKLLVSGVEWELGVPQEVDLPHSWDMLCRSGLLREPALIDFCLARTAENRIRERLERRGISMVEQLPARLLHHENPLFADTARDILVAENQSRAFDARALTRQLPLDLLHVLAWRVVAVLKTEFGPNAATPDQQVVNRCQEMLARRNDSLLLQTSAAKLAYFLPEQHAAELNDPATAGLPLFVANLSARTSVSADLVYRFIDCEAPESFLILMRASGFEVDHAARLINLLRGARADGDMLPHLFDDYSKLSSDEAASIALAWTPNGQNGWGSAQ
jgi:hypothetical protein